jgi:hypothetical protein
MSSSIHCSNGWFQRAEDIDVLSFDPVSGSPYRRQVAKASSLLSKSVTFPPLLQLSTWRTGVATEVARIGERNTRMSHMFHSNIDFSQLFC